MRLTILTATACLALVACQKQAEAPAADANATAANEVAPAPAPVSTSASLNETTWTFTQDGKAITETIDANGNYIANAGAEHVDHGTVAMVDGKACFTSAMDKKGPECWTVGDVAIGASMETTSDKGGKLTVTRVEYKPLSM